MMLNHKSYQTFLLFVSKTILILLFACFVVACDDLTDDVPIQQTPTQQGETIGIYILNEGLFNMNNSTLAYYDLKNGILKKNYFNEKNARALGDTGNDMQLYGSKLYIVVDVSSQIEVLDVHTGISLKQIPLFYQKDNNLLPKEPRRMTFFKNKLYVACFDGTVCKIDTTSLEVESTISVGQNPDGICVANNKLYVSNSGGLSFPFYGNTVSVIDIDSFTKTKDIEVSLNPYKLASDIEGDVYLSSRGDNASVPYVFQRIDTQMDEVVQIFDNINALSFVICNDTAYIYNYDFSSSSNWVKVFDCKTETLIAKNFITDGTQIDTPYGINVNVTNGDVYITDAGSFSTTGDVFCFNSKGQLQFKITDVGLNPNSIVFLNENK